MLASSSNGRRKKSKLPKWLEEIPELCELGVFVFNHYNILGRERQVGMGYPPIAWTTMNRYLKDNGVLHTEFRKSLIRILMQVDDYFVIRNNEKSN